MARAPRVLIALAAVLAAGAVPATARAEVGTYLDLGSQVPCIQGQSAAATVIPGPEGVPQVRYAWGVEDNPTTVATCALQQWSWWVTSRQQGHLYQALVAAEWLLSRQRPDGAWAFEFDFTPAGQAVPAPWISAMTQGMAISLLVRAHSATADVRYLDAARLAVAPFLEPIEQGGVLADWEGVPWYEQYAAPGAQHILNGYEFALVGLHDVAPFSPEAEQLWQQGIASLVARIDRFDAPEALSQYYAGIGGGRYVSEGSYRYAHSLLTRELADRTGHPTLLAYAARWEGYEKALPSAGSR